MLSTTYPSLPPVSFIIQPWVFTDSSCSRSSFEAHLLFREKLFVSQLLQGHAVGNSIYIKIYFLQSVFFFYLNVLRITFHIDLQVFVSFSKVVT